MAAAGWGDEFTDDTDDDDCGCGCCDYDTNPWEEDWDDIDEDISWEIEVENFFYTAESDRKHDPNESLINFYKSIDLEEKESPNKIMFRLKALKYVIMLLFNFGPSKKNEILEQYNKLLKCDDLKYNGFSPNDMNEAIRSILNVTKDQFISLSEWNQKPKYNIFWQNCLQQNIVNILDIDISMDIIGLITNLLLITPTIFEQIYNLTLDFLKNKPEKTTFYFQIAMELCQYHFDQTNYKKCEYLLTALHALCKNDKKINYKNDKLLEIYAIKIQLMSIKKHNDNDQELEELELNELMDEINKICKDINSAQQHSMGIIKEYLGRICASKNKWNEAYQYFVNSFNVYSCFGDNKVIQCVKYIIISSILCDIDINPFDPEQIKIYKSTQGIVPFVNILDAFNNNDMKQFENILSKHKDLILNDQFIVQHIDSVKSRLNKKSEH